MLKIITIPREDLIDLLRDYIISYEGDYIDDLETIEVLADGLEVSYTTDDEDIDDNQ